MKCEDVQIKLSEFIDNELDVTSKLIINEHIETCKLCSHKTMSLRQLKQKLANFDVPSLNNQFEVKLQARINKANTKNRFRVFLPIAASIALVVPLINYLKHQPPVNIPNKFIIELQSIGKTTFSDDESFHKWTKTGDFDEKYYCGSSTAGGNCFLDLEYLERI